MPDGVFVEDPAIVLDEIAVITRMGAAVPARRERDLARALAKYRELRHIVEPGTLEGGDVMRIGKTLYVGYSRRTNVAGIQQLATMLHPLGYFVVPVEVQGCLHLKSACCYIGDDTVLANRAWMDPDALCGLKILDVPARARGANALRIGETVLMPAAFPRTCELLERSGFRVRTDRQLGAAEGGGGGDLHQPDIRRAVKAAKWGQPPVSRAKQPLIDGDLPGRDTGGCPLLLFRTSPASPAVPRSFPANP